MNVQNQYQPKGGMCVTCKKLFNNCSKLHFENMPVISTTADGQVIVRCTAHSRFNAGLGAQLEKRNENGMVRILDIHGSFCGRR